MSRTLVVGTVAVLAGLVVVFVPALGSGLPLSYGAILGVGGVALLVGLALIRTRLSTDRASAELRDVESPPDHPVPGDEFDTALAAIAPRRDRANDAARAEIRERLEAAALAVLSREGHPREVALDMLDSGEWTDDPVAAAFFAAEPTTGTDDSLGDLLRTSVSGSYSFTVQAQHAAHAIAERAGVGDA